MSSFDKPFRNASNKLTKTTPTKSGFCNSGYFLILKGNTLKYPFARLCRTFVEHFSSMLKHLSFDRITFMLTSIILHLYFILVHLLISLCCFSGVSSCQRPCHNTTKETEGMWNPECKIQYVIETLPNTNSYIILGALFVTMKSLVHILVMHYNNVWNFVMVVFCSRKLSCIKKQGLCICIQMLVILLNIERINNNEVT